MSLAVTTSSTLTLVDGASLKPHADPLVVQRTPLLTIPKAHAWSPDNNTLYIISSDSIQSFSPASAALVKLFQSSHGPPLEPVVVSRDRSTLIFAQGCTIHLLAVGSSPAKITNSLTVHPALVISLSLSSDANLLASASASGTLYVHNLAHNSHTALKGFAGSPGASSKNLVCAFHPHLRTRLLVCAGKTLVIYDTSRPSGPIKTINLAEKDGTGTIPSIGYVVAISCSPFSKTLMAVAFNSGFVGLVDLERDKQ